MAPALIAIALEIAKLAAPKIVGALAGDKAEEVAGRVIDMAQEVTGTGTPEAALAKLKADPNLVLQLNVRTQEIEADLDKAYLADRANARARDIALAQATGSPNYRANWMIVGDVVGLLACLTFLVMVPDAPADVRTMVGVIASYFGLSLRDAHQFEFGSSRGSREKDALMKAP